MERGARTGERGARPQLQSPAPLAPSHCLRNERAVYSLASGPRFALTPPSKRDRVRGEGLPPSVLRTLHASERAPKALRSRAVCVRIGTEIEEKGVEKPLFGNKNARFAPPPFHLCRLPAWLWSLFFPSVVGGRNSRTHLYTHGKVGVRVALDKVLDGDHDGFEEEHDADRRRGAQGAPRDASHGRRSAPRDRGPCAAFRETRMSTLGTSAVPRGLKWKETPRTGPLRQHLRDLCKDATRARARRLSPGQRQPRGDCTLLRLCSSPGHDLRLLQGASRSG